MGTVSVNYRDIDRPSPTIDTKQLPLTISLHLKSQLKSSFFSCFPGTLLLLQLCQKDSKKEPKVPAFVSVDLTGIAEPSIIIFSFQRRYWVQKILQSYRRSFHCTMGKCISGGRPTICTIWQLFYYVDKPPLTTSSSKLN